MLKFLSVFHLTSAKHHSLSVTVGVQGYPQAVGTNGVGATLIVQPNSYYVPPPKNYGDGPGRTPLKNEQKSVSVLATIKTLIYKRPD